MDYDEYDDPQDCADFETPTREEEKAAEIALDHADEQRRAEQEQADPNPGHNQMCEGCRGSGEGYEWQVWDDVEQDVVEGSFEHCPECGGCGYYDCDGTCDFALNPDEH